MMWWWDRHPGGEELQNRRSSGRRSVYEERYGLPREEDDGLQWEPVGEIDRAGRWIVPPERGWLRRAQGWTPLDEWLRERWR